MAIGDDEGCDSNGDRGRRRVRFEWRSGTTKGAIRTAIGAKAKSNGSGLWVRSLSGSKSFSLSLAAFVRLLCFVAFWLSVFLSFVRATEIV